MKSLLRCPSLRFDGALLHRLTVIDGRASVWATSAGAAIFLLNQTFVAPKSSLSIYTDYIVR